MKNLEDKGLKFGYELVVTSYENWTRDRSANGLETLLRSLSFEGRGTKDLVLVTSYEYWTRDRSADGQKTECTLVAPQIPERTKFLIFNSSALIFN